MALMRIKSSEFKVIRYRVNVITMLHGVQTEVFFVFSKAVRRKKRVRRPARRNIYFTVNK